MESELVQKKCPLHPFFLGNMLLGLFIFAGAVFFVVTGEYATLQAREEMETLLNRVALGGLLYIAAFWFADQFLAPAVGCRRA